MQFLMQVSHEGHQPHSVAKERASPILTNKCLTCTLPLLQGSAEVPDGQYLPEPSESEDRRTPAERRYDEMMAKRAAEKTKKMAMKSHRWAVLQCQTSLCTRLDTVNHCRTGQLRRCLIQPGMRRLLLSCRTCRNPISIAISSAALLCRERIAEYNEHLSNLSEHHDIPKVGPG